MEDDRYQALEQRLTTLESKMESFNHLTGDLSTVSQRLADLEARFALFNNLVGDLSALPQQLDQLSKMEALITRLQDNFSMISDVDIFSHLWDLLAEGRFKEADQETANILFGVINKTTETITPSDIETFPIAPLRIVDRLWRKFSNDRFGLSIQLNIYRELGGDLNTLIAQDADLFLQFCDRVGWRQNGKMLTPENWEPSLASPPGFLPASWWRTHYGLKSANYVLARLIKGGF